MASDPITEKLYARAMATRQAMQAAPPGRRTKWVTVYIVQGHYGSGWEDLGGSDIRAESLATRRDYDANEPSPHRVIARKILRETFENGKW